MTRLAWLLVAGACGGSNGTMIDAHTGDAGGDDAARDASPPAHVIAYVSGNAPNLAWFDVANDTGALTAAGTKAAWAGNPSFLAFDPSRTHLYAVSESGSRVGAYAIDAATGALAFLNDVASGGSGPAHVYVEPSGKWVLAANYGDGRVGVFAIGTDGKLGAAKQVLLAGANAHEIITDPGNHFAFVPCLGSDYVAQYAFDAATGTLTPNATPHFMTASGAGPRHMAFSPDGKFAYLLAEKTSTLSALSFDGATGRLSQVQTVSTLPAGFSGANTGAEVWVHPSGAFVFTSNRGHDSIATFSRDATTGRVTLVGHTKTGGKTPRDFTLDAAGKFLYVANQGSGDVRTFAIDAQSGMLSPVGTAVTAQAPTFVGLVALP
jgi:6-phosphogluconolactonase